jgi:hypothetical protein
MGTFYMYNILIPSPTKKDQTKKIKQKQNLLGAKKYSNRENSYLPKISPSQKTGGEQK